MDPVDLINESNLDQRVATLLLVLYVMMVCWFLPISEYLRMIGGASLFGSFLFLGARVSTRMQFRHAGSIMAVVFISAAILVVPSFPAMGGKYPDAVWIGF